MPVISKPTAQTYTTLPKKVRLTEDTYLKMLEYLEWNPSLDSENDIDFLIDESIKIAIESDKDFKRRNKKLSQAYSNENVTAE